MESIIEELKYFNRKFPVEAVRNAIKAKKEITPLLLEELDRVLSDPETVAADQNRMLYMYALFLLAQFREKRAFPKIIELITLSEEIVEDLLGDVVTEDLPSILYSTYDGNVSLLKQIIEDDYAYIYVRAAALDVYGKLYTDGLIEKEELINYLRTLIENHVNHEESEFSTYIQGVVIDCHIFEMIDDIQRLYDRNQIEISTVGEFDDFIDSIYCYKYDSLHVPYMDDTIKRMSCWACFEQSRENQLKQEEKMKKLTESIAKDKRQLAEPKSKVGRNDPCPCGSGKKYKKCCLGKEEVSGVYAKVDYLETMEEQEKWLKDYPILDQERKQGEVRLTDVFDHESIEIDKLVYLALHHRAIPMRTKRDRVKEGRIKVNYLQQAFDKFLAKCEKENIDSFDAYDEKYKIHYRSSEWVKILLSKIENKGLGTINNSLAERVSEVVLRF